jgi:hypothetical protein
MADGGQKRSLIKKLQDSIRRLLGRESSPPPPPGGDPYAYRMAPVRHGPKGRSGAAVAELEDESYQAFPPRSSR